MEEVSHPKHGQHEVHAIDVAKRGEERDDTRQDGGCPNILECLDEYPSDEIAEEDGFQEP
jgi:hypothetical protein